MKLKGVSDICNGHGGKRHEKRGLFIVGVIFSLECL